jgi:DNA-binding NarL/FixJ family response regulator
VLLADDHALVRQGMAEMLSTDPGIEVVAEAANGREAVDLAREQRPDVVVLDVEMPVMSGQVALRKLLALRTTPTCASSSRWGQAPTSPKTPP